MNPDSSPSAAVPAFQEPPVASALRLLWKLTGRKRSLDRYLTTFLGYRQFLPVLPGEMLIPGFADSEIVITCPPVGPWATPANDTIAVLKAVKGFDSRRILEIGSYKGTTARLIARNTHPDARIFALDIDPEHGSAYRGMPEEAKIQRIVGRSELENAAPHGPYDLIFIDGDHSRKGAYLDSVVALELLTDDGVILWHDYHNNSYFVHRSGAVPEALRLVRDSLGIPVVSLEGTMIAMHSRKPGWETGEKLKVES